jgi:hypothetical protein
VPTTAVISYSESTCGFERPKSAIFMFMLPSRRILSRLFLIISYFRDFKSRCNIFWEWRKLIPSAISSANRHLKPQSIGRNFFRCSISNSVPAEQKSVMMQNESLNNDTPIKFKMFGCFFSPTRVSISLSNSLLIDLNFLIATSLPLIDPL